ncbi:hypothetical protein K450DRAFT_236849 [Umbelopsis ramanniana AG]|uniref:Uncharacterized protein n=1 Tax=Umbelopsis ramanniana AG TaxID=1314678 RepID=A0AAD5HDN5_UMBRA|nr:uncharacterized protein K450DRAFT_236849 [Umbelopsis ramanniana AG]KAI8580397.1 hypothetical protein K450DRAFT_236849 [Umbelopsis ramanniana AG]
MPYPCSLCSTHDSMGAPKMSTILLSSDFCTFTNFYFSFGFRYCYLKYTMQYCYLCLLYHRHNQSLAIILEVKN